MNLQDEVAQLFEEMRDGVYRYVLSLGLPPPQAQETTQEVFLRLYSALKRTSPSRTAVPGWCASPTTWP